MDTKFVEGLIKFNAQTNGRDKLCRLFQYGCRLVYGQLQTPGDGDLIKKLKNMEYMFSMTRKLLRFGKSLDFIQGALKSLHLQDTVWRLTITLSKINQAFYLLFDHFLWANNVGMVKLDKQYWSEISSRFYLTTLILNLVRDVYDVWNVLVQSFTGGQTREENGNSKGSTTHRSGKLRQPSASDILKENFPLFLDLTKNVFDLSIPMSTLHYVNLSPKMQGLYGIISSSIAIATIWNPRLKLVPS